MESGRIARTEGVVRWAAGRSDLDALHALVQGELRALVLDPFMPRQMCRSVADGFDPPAHDGYDAARYGKPAQLCGPTLDEHRVDGMLSERYWERAADAMLINDSEPEVRDLRDCCRARLAEVFATSVAPAGTADGRELHWGLVREIDDGTPVHRDDVLLAFPAGVLGDAIVGQLACTVFLTDLPEGGQTRIWAKRWSSADERFRDGSGYDADVIEEAGSVDVEPTRGSALLFDPRNYHRVLPCPEGACRLALSFFVGITPDERLIIWS